MRPWPLAVRSSMQARTTSIGPVRFTASARFQSST